MNKLVLCTCVCIALVAAESQSKTRSVSTSTSNVRETVNGEEVRNDGYGDQRGQGSYESQGSEFGDFGSDRRFGGSRRGGSGRGFGRRGGSYESDFGDFGSGRRSGGSSRRGGLFDRFPVFGKRRSGSIFDGRLRNIFSGGKFNSFDFGSGGRRGSNGFNFDRLGSNDRSYYDSRDRSFGSDDFGFGDGSFGGDFDGSFGGGRGGRGGRGSRGGRGGFGFGGDSGETFSDFLASRNKLRAADKDNKLYDAEESAGIRDQLGYKKAEGDKFSRDKNYKEEEYENSAEYSNYDSDNAIKYGHNKEVHIIDNVNLDKKDRVSYNSGEKSSSGRQLISQEKVDKESFDNESLDKAGEAYKNSDIKAASNKESLYSAENEEVSDQKGISK